MWAFAGSLPCSRICVLHVQKVSLPFFFNSNLHGLLKLNLVSFWHVHQSSWAPHAYCRSYYHHIFYSNKQVFFCEQLFCRWDWLVPVIPSLNKGMEANCWAVKQSSFSPHQNIHYAFAHFLFITFGHCSWNKNLKNPVWGEKKGRNWLLVAARV